MALGHIRAQPNKYHKWHTSGGMNRYQRPAKATSTPWDESLHNSSSAIVLDSSLSQSAWGSILSTDVWRAIKVQQQQEINTTHRMVTPEAPRSGKQGDCTTGSTGHPLDKATLLRLGNIVNLPNTSIQAQGSSQRRRQNKTKQTNKQTKKTNTCPKWSNRAKLQKKN